MTINIAEILVANSCSVSMVLLLLIFRIQNSETSRPDERLYNCMLIATLMALIAETASFLIDGKLFPGCFALQYICNTVCTGFTVLVGYLWNLFLEFKIYRSMKRLKNKALILGFPLFAVACLMVVNLFGNGIFFDISDTNVYTRGGLTPILYVTVLIYFVESICAAHWAKYKGNSVKFFPVYYFVIPCLIGIVAQVMFYGISTGWASIAIGFVFVSLQLQTFNSFVDDISGLFNRKYFNFYMEKLCKTKRADIYGILLDVNNFKKINDDYGHYVGDGAIRNIGKILSESVPKNAVPMRMAGDEFIIIITDGSEKSTAELKNTIRENINLFNNTTDRPYRLSMAMGTAEFHGESLKEFLLNIDRDMYSDKKEYYLTHER